MRRLSNTLADGVSRRVSGIVPGSRFGMIITRTLGFSEVAAIAVEVLAGRVMRRASC